MTIGPSSARALPPGLAGTPCALPRHSFISTVYTLTVTCRYFPERLVTLAQQMALGGAQPTVINEALKANALEWGLPVTWNYDDVHAKFTPSVLSRDMDATGLLGLLLEREQVGGFKSLVSTDAAGCIDKVFAELDGAMAEWAVGGSENVLLFDPTHGTNRYGIKLCCFTTVGSTGQSVILAVAKIRTERSSDIEWAFRCYAGTFRVASAVLYTDEGASIADEVGLLR